MAPEGDAWAGGLWISHSGVSHTRDPREDAAQYMEHTLRSFEEGENVMALLPAGLLASVQATALRLWEEDKLPPGWGWQRVGRTGYFVNARGERQEDPRSMTLEKFQEEVATAVGAMAWARARARARGKQM